MFSSQNDISEIVMLIYLAIIIIATGCITGWLGRIRGFFSRWLASTDRRRINGRGTRGEKTGAFIASLLLLCLAYESHHPFLTHFVDF
jgi:hypothetical protein